MLHVQNPVPMDVVGRASRFNSFREDPLTFQKARNSVQVRFRELGVQPSHFRHQQDDQPPRFVDVSMSLGEQSSNENKL